MGKIGFVPKTAFKKGHIPWCTGKHLSEEHKAKLRRTMTSNRLENHNQWKGDDVKYRGLHMWVQTVLGKPDTCEHCKTSGLTGHKIHWANKSQKYLRDLNDWLRLCAKCHKAYDGKIRK